MSKPFQRITGDQITALREEFLEELADPTVQVHKRPFLFVVGGAPGSGKTTVADTLAYISGSYHVQSNSARYLLGKYGFAWGENVHLVIQAVLEEILSTRWAVTLDGMLLQETERRFAKELAAKHDVPISFNAVLCEPKTSEERSRKRYADNKPSGFHDWRCSPERFEDYIASISSRTTLLQELMDKKPVDLNDLIWPIDNNETELDLTSWIQPVWKQMKKRL